MQVHTCHMKRIQLRRICLGKAQFNWSDNLKDKHAKPRSLGHSVATLLKEFPKKDDVGHSSPFMFSGPPTFFSVRRLERFLGGTAVSWSTRKISSYSEIPVGAAEVLSPAKHETFTLQLAPTRGYSGCEQPDSWLDCSETWRQG